MAEADQSQQNQENYTASKVNNSELTLWKGAGTACVPAQCSVPCEVIEITNLGIVAIVKNAKNLYTCLLRMRFPMYLL